MEVTSSYAERIVGVPDPYDDSIVWCAHARDSTAAPACHAMLGKQYWHRRHLAAPQCAWLVVSWYGLRSVD